MRSAPLLFLLFLSLKIYGQVQFQPGHIVNEKDEKIQCLIKNVDWLSNPDNIEYMFPGTSEIFVGTASNIKGFQVEGFSRYQSVSVDIDFSSPDFNNLSTDRNPVWEQRTVFLKNLVEGKYNLFVYVQGNMSRFFYQVENGKISQLVYKEYSTDNSRYFKENKMFLQQLWNDVKCDNADSKAIKGLKYNQPDLVKYFLKVNACHGSMVEANKVEALKEESKKFNLTVTPGFTYSTFSLEVPQYLETIEFGGSFQPRLGTEGEFIFGFHRNKWSVFIEPSFIYYKNKQGTSSVNYSAVEFPIGMRHYFYFKSDFSVFVNGMVIPGSIVFDKDLTKQNLIFPKVQASTSFAFGVGVSRGRFKLEARYLGDTDLLFRYADIYTDWKRYSLIAGYRLARK